MYLPIREISNEMGRNRFYVFSKRLQREVRLYNKLHYDHWSLIETDLSIVDYCERPHRIVVSVAGEVVETIFDMWIKTNTFEEFLFIRKAHEIDPDEKCANQKAIKEKLAQQLWCNAMNKRHRVITDEEVRSNPILLANKKTLVPYYVSNKEIKDDLFLSIIDALLEKPISIRRLEDTLTTYHKAIVRNKVYAMIYHGFLHCNQSQEILSSQTVVSLNVEKTHS